MIKPTGSEPLRTATAICSKSKQEIRKKEKTPVVSLMDDYNMFVVFSLLTETNSMECLKTEDQMVMVKCSTRIH